MSLLRRFKGGRNKQHKDDPVEVSTSTSEGCCPADCSPQHHHQQQQQPHQPTHSLSPEKQQRLALYLNAKNSSKQGNASTGRSGGVEESSSAYSAAASPSAPKQQRGRTGLLFKKKRQREPPPPSSVLTSSSSPPPVTTAKENGTNETEGDTSNATSNNNENGGAPHQRHHHVHFPSYSSPPKKNASRKACHLPPTPESVPLAVELPTTDTDTGSAPTTPPPSKTAPERVAPFSAPPKMMLSSVEEESKRSLRGSWWKPFSRSNHHSADDSPTISPDRQHHYRWRHHKRKDSKTSVVIPEVETNTTTEVLNGHTTATSPALTSPPGINPTPHFQFNSRSSLSPVITTDSDLMNDRSTTDFRNKVAKEAAALDKEGNDFFSKGEYDCAFLCYEKAMTLKRQSLYVTNQQIIHENGHTPPGSKEKKDDDNKKDDDDDRSVASQTTVDSKASILASVATSINNMTYLKQRSGQATTEETMAAYLKSLQIKRDILGPNHLSVGKTLNNIGSVFYIKREFEPALKAYENAHEIMAAQLGPEHLDVGTVISNIGDVKSALSDATGDVQSKKDALEYYRRALDIRWKALGPNDPKVIRLMEQLAWLETGQQPYKLDEELSDSEDEEYADEDRQRHAAFQQDVRVLQDELAEDMRFFDLLERKMAIDMVKDKTRCFRELRELQQELNNSAHQIAAAHAQAQGQHPPPPPPTVIHRHHAHILRQDATTSSGRTATDGRLSEAAALTTTSAITDVTPTATVAAASVTAASDSETTTEEVKTQNLVDRSSTPSNSDTENDEQQKQPKPPSIASFLDKADAAVAATTAAADAVTPSQSLYGTRSRPRKGALTANERKEALSNVRARLAALRASRGVDVAHDSTPSDTTTNNATPRYNRSEDQLRRQQQREQVVQQCPDSPSSHSPLEEGLAEVTRALDLANAGAFRMSTSPTSMSVPSPSGASSTPPETSTKDVEHGSLSSSDD